jgi:hypothetical protein
MPRVSPARDGTVVCVEEPSWLHHERRLADMPVPGSPLQPPDLNPAFIIPPAGRAHQVPYAAER